ncbi:MAG: DUF389 domain-containing protein [Campylobacterota bacterium]
MYSKAYIVIDKNADDNEVAKIKAYIESTYKADVTKTTLDTFINLEEFDAEGLYLTYLSDENVKVFLNKVMYQDIEVAILANKECVKAIKSYGLPGNYKETVDNAFKAENLFTIDILSANDNIVYTSVIFGDVYGMNKEILPDDSLYKKIKRFFRNLKRVQFNPYKIETDGENVVDTVATGVMIYEHNLKDGFISEDKSLHDGQLNALVLAPKSIFSYLYLVFILFFYKRFSLSRLPKSMGLIKSESLKITSNQQGIDYLVDGVGVSAKEVVLQVNKDALKLHLDKNVNTEAIENSEDKESLQIQNLPKGEYKKLLLKNSLPLFKKADAEDFKELFTALNSAATLSSVYIVLMIVSTLLATVGLFLDSGPVIIGAMILAPLMAPIVSLSMGVVRNDGKMIGSSATTIATGVLLALFAGALITVLMPIELHTSQIEARLKPNILDLLVAIFSGVAAAYANSKEEVAKSLAGVAIAVALVPPLAITGIGIGWLDSEVILGSFLLFITNLVGITIAASLTFIVLGYAPLVRAKKGILYTAASLVIVSIPLGFAFSDIIWQNVTQNKLVQEQSVSLSKTDVDYKVLSISRSSDKSVFLEVEVISDAILQKEDLLELKTYFQKKLDAKIWMQTTVKIKL